MPSNNALQPSPSSRRAFQRCFASDPQAKMYLPRWRAHFGYDRNRLEDSGGDGRKYAVDSYRRRPPNPLAGEVMLNTGMCMASQSGNPPPWTRAEETPNSYAGQVLIITSAHRRQWGCHRRVHSLGLPPHFESDKANLKAIAIADYSFPASHCASRRFLDEWLAAHNPWHS